MIGLALVVAGSTLAAGFLAALLLRLLPSLRARLAGLALTAVALPLAAVLLSGIAMFHMGADVVILAVAAASASAAVAAALLVAGSVSRSVGRLTTASVELARLGTSLNRMAASLGDVFDARRELVVWASHDLRTPVAAIRAMLEAIEDGVAAPEEYVPALREQTVALAGLIDDLFELAKIDAGALTIEIESLAIDDVIASCVRALEPDAQARRVHLQARVDGALPTVAGAPEQVRRILWNLLANALRHTPSDGSVVVFAEPVGNEVHVGVEDTGSGLTPEAERRMFERFWRADPSRSRADGNAGLGLAIARGLVEAQGGRIWAENRSDGGARIAFALPASEV